MNALMSYELLYSFLLFHLNTGVHTGVHYKENMKVLNVQYDSSSISESRLIITVHVSLRYKKKTQPVQ